MLFVVGFVDPHWLQCCTSVRIPFQGVKPIQAHVDPEPDPDPVQNLPTQKAEFLDEKNTLCRK
jgi:hypothetical protein